MTNEMTMPNIEMFTGAQEHPSALFAGIRFFATGTELAGNITVTEHDMGKIKELWAFLSSQDPETKVEREKLAGEEYLQRLRDNTQATLNNICIFRLWGGAPDPIYPRHCEDISSGLLFEAVGASKLVNEIKKIVLTRYTETHYSRVELSNEVMLYVTLDKESALKQLEAEKEEMRQAESTINLFNQNLDNAGMYWAGGYEKKANFMFEIAIEEFRKIRDAKVEPEIDLGPLMTKLEECCRNIRYKDILGLIKEFPIPVVFKQTIGDRLSWYIADDNYDAKLVE